MTSPLPVRSRFLAPLGMTSPLPVRSRFLAALGMTTRLGMMISGDHRRRFDLDECAGLEQTRDDDHRHRRERSPDDLAVRGADRLPLPEVRVAIGDEPRQPNEMLGAPACRGEHGDDVLERPTRLRHQTTVHDDPALRVPPDLARDAHHAPFGRDAVGVPRARGPVGRANLCRHQIVSCCRSRYRCNLPVSVRGSLSTNSIRRGYLYGAISDFTNSCSSFASSEVGSMPGRTTMNAFTTWPRSSSGAATTPHSCTARCSSNTFSTSAPDTLCPPVMIMSSVRAIYQKYPSSSSRNEAPVLFHPPWTNAL